MSVKSTSSRLLGLTSSGFALGVLVGWLGVAELSARQPASLHHGKTRVSIESPSNIFKQNRLTIASDETNDAEVSIHFDDAIGDGILIVRGTSLGGQKTTTSIDLDFDGIFDVRNVENNDNYILWQARMEGAWISGEFSGLRSRHLQFNTVEKAYI
jgi:hypothetical protein